LRKTKNIFYSIDSRLMNCLNNGIGEPFIYLQNLKVNFHLSKNSSGKNGENLRRFPINY